MKTILAICVLTAAFAVVPTADAGYVCDPATGAICASSGGAGTCDNGYAYNSVSYYSYSGTEYTSVYASTGCDASPGWPSYRNIGAGYSHCDFSTWQCESAGANWYSYGSYCTMYAYANAQGEYVFQDVGGCPAGAPPGVPALIP